MPADTVWRRPDDLLEEVVWAKIRGYPWWPGTVPAKRDYSKAAIVTFCGTGDSCSVKPADMVPFDPAAASSDARFEPPKKQREVLGPLRVARAVRRHLLFAAAV